MKKHAQFFVIKKQKISRTEIFIGLIHSLKTFKILWEYLWQNLMKGIMKFDFIFWVTTNRRLFCQIQKRLFINLNTKINRIRNKFNLISALRCIEVKMGHYINKTEKPFQSQRRREYWQFSWQLLASPKHLLDDRP